MIEIAENLIGDKTSRVRAMKRTKVEADPDEQEARVPHCPSFGHPPRSCALRGCGKRSTMMCLECDLSLCGDHIVQQSSHPRMQAVSTPGKR